MHLLEIPEDRVVGLEIPNGLPLIFDVKSKCLKVCFQRSFKIFKWFNIKLYLINI